MKLVAEYKRDSPWVGEITDISPAKWERLVTERFKPWALSVVIGEEWGGSIDDIKVIRACTSKLPIIAKEIYCIFRALNKRSSSIRSIRL